MEEPAVLRMERGYEQGGLEADERPGPSGKMEEKRARRAWMSPDDCNHSARGFCVMGVSRISASDTLAGCSGFRSVDGGTGVAQASISLRLSKCTVQWDAGGLQAAMAGESKSEVLTVGYRGVLGRRRAASGGCHGRGRGEVGARGRLVQSGVVSVRTMAHAPAGDDVGSLCRRPTPPVRPV